MWFVNNAEFEKILEDGADFNGQTLVFSHGETRPCVPAVRFMSLIDGVDEAKLLNTTALLEGLKAQGADCMQGTVILGDNAYEVEEGFADPSVIDEESDSPTPLDDVSLAPAQDLSKAVVDKVGADEPAKDDTELLTDFWLKNVE